MREGTILGILAGLLVAAVFVLALWGHDSDSTTTALTAALSTVVGVLVAVYRTQKNADNAATERENSSGEVDR